MAENWVIALDYAVTLILHPGPLQVRSVLFPFLFWTIVVTKRKWHNSLKNNLQRIHVSCKLLKQRQE